MSAANEVASAWREDVDRLQGSIKRLEYLLALSMQERNEAVAEIRAAVAWFNNPEGPEPSVAFAALAKWLEGFDQASFRFRNRNSAVWA